MYLTEEQNKVVDDWDNEWNFYKRHTHLRKKLIAGILSEPIGKYYINRFDRGILQNIRLDWIQYLKQKNLEVSK